MKHPIDRKYLIRVWLVTILVTPFLFEIALLLRVDGSVRGFFQGLPLPLWMILFGTIYSLPALLLYSILFKVIRVSLLSTWLTKFIIAIVGTILIWITFLLRDWSSFKNGDTQNYLWPIAYSAVFAISSALVRIKSEDISFQEK